jgi:alpha-tubulin suppressor-like RCC1 family protein
MINSSKLFRLSIVFLLLAIEIAIIAAPGCSKKRKSAKTGSSNEWAGIAAPSSLNANSILPYQINLIWQDNSNNEDGFVIERWLGDNKRFAEIATLSANATSYSNNGLLFYSTYYYRVRAFNTIGDTSNYSNEANALTLLPLWTEIHSGIANNIARSNDGAIWTWGFNFFGMLGLGDNSGDRLIPTVMSTQANWSKLSSTRAAVFLIRNDGTLWGCGFNGTGQLGNNTPQYDEFTLVQLSPDTDWSMVANGGWWHTIAIKNNLTIWSTGLNDVGQLGLGDAVQRNTFSQVDTATDWSYASSGGNHSLALKTDRTLWSWGYGGYGALGIGDTMNRYTPTQIGTDSDWSTANACSHTMVIKTDRTLWTWGYNSDGQLGIGDSVNRNTPVQVGTDSDWSAVSGAYSVTLAIKTDRTLWVWGGGPALGLGGSVFYSTSTPVQNGTQSDWSTVSSCTIGDGGPYAVALKTDNTLWGWGFSGYGQLGLGEVQQYTNIPTQPGNPPYKPSSITSTVISCSQINLNWDDMTANETGFSVERKTEPDGVWEIINTVITNETSYSDTGLEFGVGYSYRVRAFNNIGYSLYSAERVATPTVIAPSLAITIIDQNQINLSWIDNSIDELGFKIERKVNNGSWAVIYTVGANITSYSDTTVLYGNNYYYRVSAYNELGDGPYSNESSSLPSPLGSLVIQAVSSNQINLSWNWATSSTSNTKIERKETGLIENWSEIATVASDISTYSDNSAFNINTVYYYRVKTYNLLGDGGYLEGFTVAFSDWDSFSAGETHTIALKTNGVIWCWGKNNYGQLGIGYTSDYTRNVMPVQVGAETDWSKIAAGVSASYGIKNNNTLWSWGDNNLGKLGLGDAIGRNTPSQIGADLDWLAISCGGSHTLALQTNNSIWSWGINTNGQLGLGNTTNQNIPVRIGVDTDWSKIDAGINHSLAIKTNNSPTGEAGTLWSWGKNQSGELGLGDTIDRYTPTQIGIRPDWNLVTAGYQYTIARDTAGTIWSWGDYNDGKLGLGEASILRLTPSQVNTNIDWSLISANYEHVLAITNSRTMLVWGLNTNKQLGLDDLTNKYMPFQAGTNSDWFLISSEVSNSRLCSFALKNNRTIWGWGANTYGQLGLESTNKAISPTLISADKDWSTVSCGYKTFALGLKTNQTRWGWGINTDYQLGNDGDDSIYTPTLIGTDTDWIKISAGQNFGVGIKSDGTIWSWGKNVSFGQLGLGDITSASVPTRIGIDTNWSDIKSGYYHNLAIKNNKTLWGWGKNNYKQLGLGDNINRNTPAQIGTLSDWSKIILGTNHSLAIKTNPLGGTLWSWGWNNKGQLGLGDIVERTTPVQVVAIPAWSEAAAGDIHTIGIRTNGCLYSWGDNAQGQLGLGMTGSFIFTPTQIGTHSDWSQVASKLYHNIAIKTNLTIWAWGKNAYGQLGLADTNNRNVPVRISNDFDWSMVSVGENATIAIKTDLTIWGWGDNSSGQIGLGQPLISDRYGVPTLVGFCLPAVPVLNTSVYSPSRINVSWTDISSNESGFILERRKNEDGIWEQIAVLGPNMTSYADTDAAVYNTHYYRMKAYNGYGKTDYSNESIITVCLPAPSVLTATVVGLTGIDLFWTDINEETGYKIERKSGVNGTWEEITTTTADIASYFDNTGLDAGITFYYRVRGYQGVIDGNYSPEATAQIIYFGPSYLTATAVSISQIDLTWPDIIDEEGYKIERRSGTGGIWEQIATTVPNAISYTNNSGLSSGVTYYYRVKGYIGGINSSYSPESSATIATMWTKISCGNNHSLGLEINGYLWAWGDNYYCQLGVPDYETRFTPCQISTVNDWSMVYGGNNYTIALRSNGTMWSWGLNDVGQLGVGDTDDRYEIVQAGTDSDWAKIIIKYGLHSLGIKTTGTLWSWGANGGGQLGLSDTINRYTPTQINADTNWVSASVGSGHTITIKNNPAGGGTIWSFGKNLYGQLGLGYTSPSTTGIYTPTQIGSTSDWSYVASGSNHNIALKTNNTVWTWGRNNSSQLGLGPTSPSTYVHTPTQVGTDSDWSVMLSAGNYHTLAMKTNGAIWSWGVNSSGQLGVGDNTLRNTPSQVTYSDWSIISSGYNHNLALKTSGSIWSWGSNGYGQLGLGSSETILNRNTPTLIGQ